MTATGWIGEGPDAGAAMPVTERMLAMKQRGPGDALALAMARSRGAEAREARDEAAGARDPDEYAANLVTRGYMPGMVSQLSMKLADVQADLEDEQAKFEKGARRQEIAMREHAAGRIGALAVQRMLDGDFGDEGRVRQLERRAESLRGQIAEAQSMISPPSQRDPDPLEAAAQRAHAAFAELTRARIAEAEARRGEPRPFGSASRGAADTEHSGPDCQICAQARRMEAKDPGPYPAGAVITTEYRELAR
jgi:hypothetical protein